MNSTVFFSTPTGNSYLFDVKKQYLLNLHPIVELIHHCSANSFSESNTLELMSEKYPELTDNEIRLYQGKYVFLKKKGFFSYLDTDEMLTERVTANTVKNQLINLLFLTFQMTGECNLNCRYCCYGDLYERNKIENRAPMQFDTVKKTFDYLLPLWKLFPYSKLIGVGFYGGEPLLNFSLIEKTVSYCKLLETSNNVKFSFSITTNGVLLNRYSNYLTDNDFRILISLDGDERANSLRVDKSNRPSFGRVFSNIKKLQNEYPDYFIRRVDFNAVMNRNSTAEGVNDFIFKQFGKKPVFSPLSKVGINRDRVNELLEILQPPSTESEELIVARKEKSSKIQELGAFFFYNLNNSFKFFSEILCNNKFAVKKYPTGTCLPFNKKIYITSDNKIYACERIGLGQILGEIGEEVHIDLEEVADRYTAIYSHIKKQCTGCYMADMCSECLFQFPFDEKGMPMCPNQCGEEEYKKSLKAKISFLETHQGLFNDVNKMVLQ